MLYDLMEAIISAIKKEKVHGSIDQVQYLFIVAESVQHLCPSVTKIIVNEVICTFKLALGGPCKIYYL